MIFVLNGVETKNKGAELMLYAILQEIESRFPDATVYVGVGSVSQGLSYVKTSLKLKYKPLQKYYKLIRKFKLDTVLQKLHLPQILSDIYAVKGADYFIDGSGLRFSDQQKNLKNQLYKYEHLLRNQKKQGSKIVFLPQTFGPIQMDYTKTALKSLNRYADLIMPRENKSLAYLKNSGLVDMKKVKLFTDFTSLIHGHVPAGCDHLAGAVCVIPNERMISKGIISRERYIILLKNIIEFCKNQQKKVYLLNHEGILDEILAYECQKRIGNDIEVVTGLNALEVKGLISTASLVITSRFHGLASSLNSCVPCLATSWSHKYEELFSRYGISNAILDVNNCEECLNKVSNYLDQEFNQDIRNKLKDVLPNVQAETRNMWHEIWQIK